MIYLIAVAVITCLSFVCARYAPRVFRIIGGPRAAQFALNVMEVAERLALDAIGFAEERARDSFKKTGRKMSGSAKLNLAIAFFYDHAGDRVLTMFPRGVGDWIEAKLGMIRGMPTALIETAVPGIVRMSGQPIDTFVPGVGTVRSCIDCPRLVVGGPTRCTSCAERVVPAGAEDTQPA